MLISINEHTMVALLEATERLIDASAAQSLWYSKPIDERIRINHSAITALGHAQRAVSHARAEIDRVRADLGEVRQ